MLTHGRRLEPHEASTTDVVLLGHSLGGILSAEVVLLGPQSPNTGQTLRHRILGTINFDTPFLGMHPGVIKSGLSSLFRPAESPAASPMASPNASMTGIQPLSDHHMTPPSDPFFMKQPTDPNYNPVFNNDVILPVRKGLSNALHFINKHSDGLTKATSRYVKSHLEFGGCLADLQGLKIRYNKIRSLEEKDGSKRRMYFKGGGNIVPRVRFVNYYTASTGRPKKPSSPGSESRSVSLAAPEAGMSNLSLSPQITTVSSSLSPRISVDEYREDDTVPKAPGEPMRDMEPYPESSDSEINSSLQLRSSADDSASLRTVSSTDPSTLALTPTKTADSNLSLTQTASESQLLMPIPPPPAEPPSFDHARYATASRDERKLAEREHNSAVKAYEQALKAREKLVRGRQKLVEKQEKARLKEAAKTDRLRQKEELKRQATLNPEDADRTESLEDVENEKGEVVSVKKKRDKKFCTLPAKDASGVRDPCWVRIFMEGVDEVGAHCGLFFPGSDRYTLLVEDVGKKIWAWLGDAAGEECGVRH